MPIAATADVRARAHRPISHWLRGVANRWQIIHLSPTLPPPTAVIDSWQTTADRAGTPHALSVHGTAQHHRKRQLADLRQHVYDPSSRSRCPGAARGCAACDVTQATGSKGSSGPASDRPRRRQPDDKVLLWSDTSERRARARNRECSVNAVFLEIVLDEA